MPILRESLVKRNIDVKSLDPQKIETSNFRASQKIFLKSGIDRELAKKITTLKHADPRSLGEAPWRGPE